MLFYYCAQFNIALLSVVFYDSFSLLLRPYDPEAIASYRFLPRTFRYRLQRIGPEETHSSWFLKLRPTSCRCQESADQGRQF